MGSAVCAGGWICAISLPKGGCTHAWVQKCDTKSKFHHFLFPDTFWVIPYPLQQKKGGVKFCPQRTLCVGCLLGENGAFLETRETRFPATMWVSGLLQYAPRACPVKHYSLECWRWAEVGSDSCQKTRICVQLSNYKSDSTR